MAIELRFSIFKDPWSATTHFGGFLAALVGAPLLVAEAWHDGARTAVMSIYGLALVGLFGASSVYHFFDLGERGNHWLRRLDHAAIFLFIAACFVPVSTVLLDGVFRAVVLSVVATLGLAGAAWKLLRFHAPLWLDMTAFLGLGWMGLLVVPAVATGLGAGALALIMAGGVAYTLGAVVYILQRPDPWPDTFGHHEVWHVFVLAGATAHYFFNLALAR